MEGPLHQQDVYMTMRSTTLSHILPVLKTPPLTWQILPFKREYIDKITEVAEEHAFIDPENKKRDMWRRVLNGGGSFFVAETDNARIYYISESYMDEAKAEVPWDLWARIFQLFGNKKQRWEATIFAADRPRFS